MWPFFGRTFNGTENKTSQKRIHFLAPKSGTRRTNFFLSLEVARRGNRAPQTMDCDFNLFVEPLRQVPQVPSSCPCVPSELWKRSSVFSAPRLSMLACMSLAFNVIVAVFSHPPTRPSRNGVLAQTIMSDTPRHTGSVHIMSAACCMHLAHGFTKAQWRVMIFLLSVASSFVSSGQSSDAFPTRQVSVVGFCYNHRQTYVRRCTNLSRDCHANIF